MGITGLWQVLGEGEVWHLADYAKAFFEEHKRPLRIAVDEACWRFTNLTPEQVERIREGEPAANPIEKVILWRILRLWRLNVRLLFVHDGQRKPGKSRHEGHGGLKVDAETVRLLHQMFDALRVPYHQAPGEAEAECAKLQRLGVVDAVWSDDGDAFMFGCTRLIKQHKVGQNRDPHRIRIYKAEEILTKHDWDADCLAVFAILAGGDYDTKGLPGCGPVLATQITKRMYGLARALRLIPMKNLKRDLPLTWRKSLIDALQICGQSHSVNLPPDFPKHRAVAGYLYPAVSTDERARDLRKLRNGWEVPIDHLKLRRVLRERYNFTTREYLRHIAPVALVGLLVRDVSSARRQQNLAYDIKLKRRIQKKDENGDPLPKKSEVKITFSAARLVEDDNDLRNPPQDEDWTKFAAKDGTPYDPFAPIEGEILECFLRHGLPEGSLVQAPPAPRKRMATAQENEAIEPVWSLQGESRHSATNTEPSIGSTEQSKKRSTRSRDESAATKLAKRARTTNDPANEPEIEAPTPTFKLLDTSTVRASLAQVVCLDDSVLEDGTCIQSMSQECSAGRQRSIEDRPPAPSAPRPTTMSGWKPLARSRYDRKTAEPARLVVTESSKHSRSTQQRPRNSNCGKSETSSKAISTEASHESHLGSQCLTARSHPTRQPYAGAPALSPPLLESRLDFDDILAPTSSRAEPSSRNYPVLPKVADTLHSDSRTSTQRDTALTAPPLETVLIPGLVIAPATLRELRLARLNKVDAAQVGLAEDLPTSRRDGPRHVSPFRQHEVIDLT